VQREHSPFLFADMSKAFSWICYRENKKKQNSVFYVEPVGRSVGRSSLVTKVIGHTHEIFFEIVSFVSPKRFVPCVQFFSQRNKQKNIPGTRILPHSSVVSVCH
jgi:hypothetical protein